MNTARIGIEHANRPHSAVANTPQSLISFMERATITVAADTKVALAEWKSDDETWDEFMRSLLAGPDDHGDYPSEVDLSDGSMKDIETMLDRQFESLRSEFR